MKAPVKQQIFSSDTENEMPESTCHIGLKLNARLRPVDRHDLEDTFQGILQQTHLGDVSGGGTMLMPSGEVKECDIEIVLQDDSDDSMKKLVDIVNQVGVPKGSELRYSDLVVPVGEQEGLVVYINGTELPDEVYSSCNINYAVKQMNVLMEGIGCLRSYWEGPKDSAFYFYGTSYEKMKAAITGFIAAYPLCQKAVWNGLPKRMQ